MNRKDKKQAYLAALMNALIIGFSFLFVKLALTVSNPLDTLAHRFTASFIAATIPVLFGWIKIKISMKDLRRILPLALLYPALFFALQAYGLLYTTSSEAGIIQAMAPIFTMILATYFLQEKSTYWQKLSVLLSVGGVILIIIMKGASFQSVSLLGPILILLSALAISGYNVLARPLTKQFHVMELTYVMITIGFLVFNGISIVQHVMNGSIQLYFQPLTSPIFLISILYLGILSSLVTALLATYALSKIEATKMSVFGNLATLLSMVAGVIFLDETLSYYHLIGAVMIILGVLGTNLLDQKAYKKVVKL
ncbi:DMT family transporter [Rubeoparvulum massiliense]|uniref:DMT family transporter n=1 Tax=Rubeoparvulum massiliense TaxID=1631346 RepID=UPI000AD7E9CE|nr:DMT family transporter [Rubeoparvulum massiliense]